MNLFEGGMLSGPECSSMALEVQQCRYLGCYRFGIVGS